MRLATAHGSFADPPVREEFALGMFRPNTGSTFESCGRNTADLTPRGLLTGRAAFGGSVPANRAAGFFESFAIPGGAPIGTTVVARIGYVPPARRLAKFARKCQLFLAAADAVTAALTARSDELADARIEMVVSTPGLLDAVHPYLGGLPYRIQTPAFAVPYSYEFTDDMAGNFSGSEYPGHIAVRAGELAPVGGGRFSLILATTVAAFRVLYVNLNTSVVPLRRAAASTYGGYFSERFGVRSSNPGPTTDPTVAPAPGAVDLAYALVSNGVAPPAQEIRTASYLVARPDLVAADASLLLPHAERFDRYAVSWITGSTSAASDGQFFGFTPARTYTIDPDPAVLYEPVRPAGVDYSYQFVNPADAEAFAAAIVQKALDDLT